jgi:plastocyanin
MLAGGFLWGLSIGEEVGFFGVTGVAALIAGFLVSRFGTWAKVVGIVVAFLVMGALFWTIFGLFSPNSFFDFVPGLVVIPGGILAIVSCIAAIVAARRGHFSENPIGGESRGMRIAIGLFLVLAVLSAVLTLTGSGAVETGDAELEVTLSDFEFDEESYEVDGGSTVVVRNDDPFLHTFSIEELDVDQALSPGAEIVVEIPDEAGSYVVFCRPHTSDPEDPSGEDMAADFEVR